MPATWLRTCLSARCHVQVPRACHMAPPRAPMQCPPRAPMRCPPRAPPRVVLPALLPHPGVPRVGKVARACVCPEPICALGLVGCPCTSGAEPWGELPSKSRITRGNLSLNACNELLRTSLRTVPYKCLRHVAILKRKRVHLSAVWRLFRN